MLHRADDHARTHGRGLHLTGVPVAVADLLRLRCLVDLRPEPVVPLATAAAS
jgi:hypothetical protein